MTVPPIVPQPILATTALVYPYAAVPLLPIVTSSAQPSCCRAYACCRDSQMHRIEEPNAQLLREALAPYVDIQALRRLATEKNPNLQAALRVDNPPLEVRALLNTLAAVLHPLKWERIVDATDVAALLLVEMSRLEQEQLRLICLDTKNHLQTIQLVYQGTLGSVSPRVAELFRTAIRHNSASIILVHNHPSGDPTPSAEDIEFTESVIEAGALLNIQVLDHLVIGRGRWISIRRYAPIFN
jgi:DNA repair protein RadC